MWEMFHPFLSWLAWVFLGGQGLTFIGLVLRMIWTDAIEPRLIPAAEINRVAVDLIACYAEPRERGFRPP